jgi:AbrB family looped-hinge helix DNA binding protein
MAKVDSKGRVVLPQAVRERLGIVPGTEVEIRTKGGRAVIEPERDPEYIIERMESLIDEAAADRRSHSYEDLDVFARKHAETIRRQARASGRDDE